MPIDYPERLLPSVQKINSLSYSKECFLCRRSIEKEKMLDEDGELDVAAIEAERLFDYSTNLVNCPEHTTNCIETNAEDVLIVVEPKKYYKLAYQNNDEDVPKAEELSAELLDNCGYFLIRIKDCEFSTSYPFPVNKPNSKVNKLEVKVLHAPNLINICHFQFECWSDVNNNGTLKVIKAGNTNPETFREQIVHAIRNVIMDNIHLINNE